MPSAVPSVPLRNRVWGALFVGALSAVGELVHREVFHNIPPGPPWLLPALGLLWGAVHIAFLIGFRHRLQVLLSWFWNWMLNARDARLITGQARLDIEVPRAIGFAADSTPPPSTERHVA